MNTYCPIELERSIVGATLNGAESPPLMLLHPLVFADSHCRVVWVGIMELAAREAEIDLSTILDWLTSTSVDAVLYSLKNYRMAEDACGILANTRAALLTMLDHESDGGDKAITMLPDGIVWLSGICREPASYGSEQNCETILDAYRARLLLAGLARVQRDADATRETSADLIGKLDDLCTRVATGEDADGSANAADIIDRWMESPELGAPQTTGFAELDRITGGGVHGGGMYVIAARPGGGKTALAMQIATKMVQDGGKPVYASFELQQWLLAMRHLQLVGNITDHDIIACRENRCSADQADSVNAAKHIQRELSPAIPNVSAWELKDLVSNVKRMHARGECTALFVDYIQLVRNKYNEDTPRISETSRVLTNLALRLNIPVICVAQLNRESEKGSRQPRMSDLKGSGQIEQDATWIMMLDRPNECEQGPVRTIRAFLAKNRLGEQCIRHTTCNFLHYRFHHRWSKDPIATLEADHAPRKHPQKHQQPTDREDFFK